MLSKPRIGYVPYSATLEKPGDRRRFACYAEARNLDIEIARPTEKYDLVVLSEMADISAWCKYPHGKIVYDFIDSYLAIPRTNLKQWLRGVVWYAVGRHAYLRLNYWSTLEDMCRRSDAVVCTTLEQQNDIQAFCKNTHIVLDIHRSVVRSSKHDFQCSSPFRIVWEGLPSNLTQLKELSSAIRKVHQKSPIELHVVTDPLRPRFLGRFGVVKSSDVLSEIFDHVRIHDWSEQTCADIVKACDLAVIPIDLSDPFVSGKPENKLLLLWRMGIAVLASSTPAYVRAMQAAGLTGMVCKNSQEWESSLNRLIGDEVLRRDAGRRGRDYAETHFGAEAMLAGWDRVFESVGFQFRTVQ